MNPEAFFSQFRNLERTGDFGRARTLDRIRELLARVGNPQRRLPPIITVAGSKGKGSVTHLTAAILSAAGLRVGRYTSPHIISWHERIVVEDQAILDEEAEVLITRYGDAFLSHASNGERATYFEVMTAMALLYFANRALDAVVLEVGLGGRYDAVNVCDAEVGVITQLGLEHQNVLGDTLAQIAAEKAGILRPAQYAVLEQQPVEATAVLWSEAERVGAFRLDAGHWMIRQAGADSASQKFFLTQADQSLVPLRLRLLGEHQLRNARLAVIAALAFCEKTKRVLPDEAISRGLWGVRIPARMELLEEETAKRFWLLDGAHNRESAAALAAAVRRHFAGRPVRLAVGMMRDKNPLAFLEELKILNPVEVTAVGMESERAWTPQALADQWKAAGLLVRVSERWPSAAQHLTQASRPGELIVVTGSLYLAGEARKALTDS